MRIWDIHPGYLDSQSLLGEHGEIHGLISVLRNHKKGYSNHPETLRWKGHIKAACLRHDQLAAEMRFRAYNHQTPVTAFNLESDLIASWPKGFIDEPGEQFRILKRKYAHSKQGRIPLPRTNQALWAHHKFSVMARDVRAYHTIGNQVARMPKTAPLDELALQLVTILRKPAPMNRLGNAVEHLWGFLEKKKPSTPESFSKRWKSEPENLLHEIWDLAKKAKTVYLLHSTALSDFEWQLAHHASNQVSNGTRMRTTP
ncbi:MAG TPA: pyrimidine dimer DNA glycosylase/endonuclease V [Bdellovibrionota bacterium]|nr:pyrimidine dimer DNA glycosylase/endonuclease V [Bdellovibrionota bacterium]